MAMSAENHKKLQRVMELMEEQFGVQFTVTPGNLKDEGVISYSTPTGVQLGYTTITFNTQFGDIIFGTTAGMFMNGDVGDILRTIRKQVEDEFEG